MKFFIFSEYGALLDVACRLQREGHEVLMHIPDKECALVGNGMVRKTDLWYRSIGQGYIWVFDSNEYGDIQDWLREKGELVFGGSAQADGLENDRQKNQGWLRDAGFRQPFSKNFKSIDEAIGFVRENRSKRWILKQNGSAPKSLNHLGKFPESEDMIFHLEELKKRWNVAQHGTFDCDLMEVVEGVEIAASAFFNGHDFLKDKEGKVVGFLNFEEKKEADGGTGQTTGEMGTTFIGVTEDNPAFSEILLRPKIIETLRAINFRGVFDINAIDTEDGWVGLEPTLRFGVPATSYEFIEGLASGTGDLLASVASGTNEPIDIYPGFGIVMWVVGKPFPISTAHPENSTLGERLWVLKDGKPAKDFSAEQWEHIHLYNIERSVNAGGEACYTVPTLDGYLFRATMRGGSVADTRAKLIRFIKENVYLYGMKYRTDIGERIEKVITEYI